MKHAALILLALVLTLCVSGCSDTTQIPVSKSPRPVVTYKVPDVMHSRQWSTSGTTKNSLETPLSFRIAGTIIKLPAKVGMRVDTGQILATLDPTDPMLELRAADAGLKDLLAELTNAETNYKRVKALADQEVVSKSEYDQALAEYDSLKAKVARQREQVALAKRNLSYTKLTAPQAGRINSVPVDLHRNVTAGQAVVVMSSGSRLEIEVGIPDKIIPYVAVGDQVGISFDVFQDVRIPGTVTEVGVATDGSVIYPVTVTLDKEDDRLRAGMVGEVTFDFKQVADMGFVSVPSVAVFGDPDGKHYVWVVTNDKTVHRREVQVGFPDQIGLVIRKGLEPGDVVVTRGVHSIREGQEVLLQD